MMSSLGLKSYERSVVSARLKELGCTYTEIETACNHTCYLVTYTQTRTVLLIIPSDVLILSTKIYYNGLSLYKFSRQLEGLSGKLYVFGGENVLDASYMFIDTGFNDIDLKGMITNRCETMCCMFYSCKDLIKVDLTGVNTKSVKYMEGLFCKCEKLPSVNLKSFSGKSLLDMSHIFECCHSLKSIDLSGLNADRILSMSCAFASCDGLKSLNLSGICFNENMKISHLCYDCRNLKNIEFGARPAVINIGDYPYCTFCGCTNLRSLHGDITLRVVNKGDPFRGCSNFNTNEYKIIPYMG